MAVRVHLGRAPWLERLVAQRDRVGGEGAAITGEATALLQPAPTPPMSEAASLATLGIPPEVAGAHPSVLAATMGDAAGLLFAGRKLAAHVRSFTDGLARFYTALGHHLDVIPAPLRVAQATRAVSALRQLVEELGASPEVVPVLISTAALLDGSRRGWARRDHAGGSQTDHAALGENAVATVRHVVERFQGAPGLGAMLLVVPNLVEQLDLFAPPESFAAEASRWMEVTAALGRTMPRAGVSLADASRWSERLASAIARKSQDPLAAASSEALDETKDKRDSLLGRLRAAGTPLARALTGVIEASPAGPAALFEAVAAVLSADNPALVPWVEALSGNPAAHVALDRLAKTPPAYAPGADLAGAFLTLDGLAPADLGATLDPWRLFIALIAGPTKDPSLLRALASAAKSPESDRTYLGLFELGQRHQRAKSAVMARFGQRQASLVAALARHGVEQPGPILDALAQVRGRLPAVDLPQLVGRDGEGRPGLLSLLDPTAGHRNDPLPHFWSLLGVLGEAPPEDPRLQTSLARVAIQIADALGRQGLNPTLPRARVMEDWRLALDAPRRLGTFGASALTHRGALTSGMHGLPGFFAAHPALPPELALTAGVHLTGRQIEWLEARLAQTGKSLSGTRVCRDFVFGLAAAQRTDVLDAILSSLSSPKAVSSIIEAVAVAFRRSELDAMPFDAIVEGLIAGRDPMADIALARRSGTLDGIDLLALTEGRVTTEGAALIARCSKQLNFYLGLFRPGGASFDGLDQAYIRPLFLEVIRGGAEGTWPARKYSGEINLALLGILPSPGQAMWKERMITPATWGEAPAQDLQSAMELLSGIGAGMIQAIDLGAGPAGPFRWDAATLSEATALRAEQIAAFRDTTRGSPGHQRAAHNLGMLQEVIALLELHEGLKDAPADPATALPGLRCKLERALPALVARGGEAFREAASLVLDATKGLVSAPTDGRYAVDDDALEACIKAPLTGCFSLAWTTPGRHWAMASNLLDANIRTLRVMDGDQQRCRALYKVFRGSFEGYEGPVIWVDPPQADGGGSDDDQTLLYRHAIRKAQAMGYPVMSGADHPAPDQYPDPLRIGKVGKSLRLDVLNNVPVTIEVRPGNVGYVHSDTLFGATMPNVDQARGQDPFLPQKVVASAIVMPKMRSAS